MSSAKNMASMFEQKAKDASVVQTNTTESRTGGRWTPTAGNDQMGAHSATGYKMQARRPPKKRSLADLP